MKKTIVASAIVLSSLVACTKSATTAGSSDDAVASTTRHGADDSVTHQSTAGIPAAVISAFNNRSPSATRVEYQQEGENGVVMYKVKFFLGADRWRAFFKPDGTFISAARD